jgi:hypothetical protein
MRQRMSATERRNQLLTIMHDMHQRAESQADFTPKKIAELAGISKVMLYRLVCSEFQTLRSQLPGPCRPYDEVLRNLRLENTDLRRQLREARAKLRATAVEELDKAMQIMEDLEKKNLQLRNQVALLNKRLREGGHVIVQIPPPETPRHNLRVVNNEKDKKPSQEQQQHGQDNIQEQDETK